MAEPVKITKLERQLLCDLAQSDHSSDGHGFTMWVGVGYESLPMRQVRALITTLREKGIIHYTAPNPRHDEPAHIGPCAAFIEGGEQKSGERSDGSKWTNIDPDHERFGGDWNSDPFTDGIHGFRYTNLEVIQ
tara:strand:+ start:3596 stop:3994 length:399 start_codon:yes stop_codon:yes gene_type:complete